MYNPLRYHGFCYSLMTSFLSKFNSIDSNYLGIRRKKEKNERNMWDLRFTNQADYDLINNISDVRALRKTMWWQLLSFTHASIKSSTSLISKKILVSITVCTRQQKFNSLESSFIYTMKKEPEHPKK